MISGIIYFVYKLLNEFSIEILGKLGNIRKISTLEGEIAQHPVPPAQMSFGDFGQKIHKS